MNVKDNEALEKWREDSVATREQIQAFQAMSEHERIVYCITAAWKGACEYKQKEIDNLRSLMQSEALLNTSLHRENQKIQDENRKLRECLEFYANSSNYSAEVDYKGLHYVSMIGEKFELGEDNGKRAREVLKNLYSEQGETI